MDFSNQVVTVVGSDTTVGKAIASGFKAGNARLTLVDYGEVKTEEASGHKGSHQVLHLTNNSWDEPKRIMQETKKFHGKIDVLVFITPPALPQNFLSITDAEWEDTTSSVLQLGLRFIQELSKHQDSSIEQRIIFVMPAHTLMAFQGSSLQSSTCAALELVAKVAAVDLGSRNIKVNSVVYGWMNSDQYAMYEIPEEQADLVKSGIPLGRCADPQEVGQVVQFLSSPHASYITGTTIKVDGGYLVTLGNGKAFPK